ncbi:MAG: 1-acyl-sn-glycerol-3-phosphate acyltransferase [Clostridium sp.]|nr:1-acyl-sn-glycerol-3-phosphate acyltransferase [Clostridium sp.]MCM1548134.1 1-acyl-sn-glycerol-3-phosphate acyltransferase [Ruminococcus sp.]
MEQTKVKVSIPFRFLYYFVKLIYYIAYNVKVEGRENLPDGVFIIASNHRSFADPPLLAVTSGCGKFSFVAKAELFRFPPFAWLIRKLGAFPVERGKGDQNTVALSAEKLKEGRKLVIFPEGTRSKTGKVGRGKTGVALIAAKSGFPIVPAGIIYSGKLHFRSKVTIKYGKPIYPEDFNISEDATPHDLKEVKSIIMSSIIGLVEGEANGDNQNS